MKKLKISIIFIRRIKVGDLGNSAATMNLAIWGNILVFTGAKPFTQAEVTAIINSYLTAKTAYKLGGTLAKNPYLLAKKALIACLVAFAGYVNTLADGNKVILELSTLPIDEPKDYAALIAAGAIAEGVTAVQGGNAGQIITDCKAYGTGINYLSIVSEGAVLPANVLVHSNGQVQLPIGSTNRIFVSGTGTRRKSFVGCVKTTIYYVYYALVYGELAGVLTDPISIVCSK